MTIFTLGGLIGAITYLTLKIVDIWTTADKGKYLSSRKSLTFFSTYSKMIKKTDLLVSLTIVMSAITFILGIMNYLQFGRGLKEKRKIGNECAKGSHSSSPTGLFCRPLCNKSFRNISMTSFCIRTSASINSKDY